MPTPVGMDNVPAAAFITTGAKVRLYVQLAPAAIDVPQVVAPMANGPVTAAVETEAEVFPELVRVTAWSAEVEPTVWLPKATVAGDAASTASRPRPESDTVCEPASVSTTREPVAPFMTVGVKLTL